MSTPVVRTIAVIPDRAGNLYHPGRLSRLDQVGGDDVYLGELARTSYPVKVDDTRLGTIILCE